MLNFSFSFITILHFFVSGTMFAEHMGCDVVSAPVVGGGAGGYWAVNDGHTAVRGSDNDNSAVHVSYMYKWGSAGR